MNGDDLDKKTEKELNEIFAVEVAGWCQHPAIRGFWSDHKNDDAPMPKNLYKFSTDANAVLPYIHEFGLQKFPGGEPYYFEAKSPICREQGWMLRLVFAHHDGDFVSEQTEAPTFARAACIALIRAKRD